MASLCKETSINASPEHVWAAIEDFGTLHTRLVPGFVVDAKLDGDIRTLTFWNGAVVKEVLVGADARLRRLAYAILEGKPTHYNGSIQVFAEPEGRSRLVWIIDLLPNELSGYIDSMMQKGIEIMRQTLEKQ